jgi:hypothetical protein
MKGMGRECGRKEIKYERERVRDENIKINHSPLNFNGPF